MMGQILTTQRKLILDIITQITSHPTAGDIMEQLKLEGHSVSYATVYNSLRFLTEHGYIHELKLEGDASRYDGRTDEHQHIICTKCGNVDEVKLETPPEWKKRIEKLTEYKIFEEQIIFKGLCHECYSEIL